MKRDLTDQIFGELTVVEYRGLAPGGKIHHNNIGYLDDNRAPCCWECNDAKGTKSKSDFIRHCTQVARLAASDALLITNK